MFSACTHASLRELNYIKSDFLQRYCCGGNDDDDIVCVYIVVIVVSFC